MAWCRRRSDDRLPPLVPAKAGTQYLAKNAGKNWIPAFAGMSGVCASEHRRSVQTEMSEQFDERLQPFAPIRLDIDSIIVEKARTIAQSAASFRHVALNDFRRGIALIAQRTGEIAARIIKNVAAAPVDEFQHAEHREAKAEAVTDRLVDV